MGWVLAALGNTFHECEMNRNLPQENLLMGKGDLSSSSHLLCRVGRRRIGWVAGYGSP